MKSLLAFLVAMSIIVTLSDAYCFSKLNKPGEATKGCILDGKMYPFGEIERTEDCFRCSCSKKAISCCSLFTVPVRYDKNNCEVVLNKQICDYDVVQRSDHSKECFAYSRTG